MQLRAHELLRDRAFVAGSWIAADSGATVAVCNPATGALLGRVPDMGAAETRRAIAAADDQHAAGPSDDHRGLAERRRPARP